MNLIYSAGFAAIMACGVYLLLSRHVMRIVYGVILISASVNLVLFLSGRIGPNPPPVIPSGETVLSAGAANPLPQALVLTAIVIGFSLVAFAVALALQTFRTIGTLDSRKLNQAEALGSPYEEGKSQ
ncbi:cation:proton antiporter [Sandaracinobacter neustonicus]|uniref:Cation:proton antiporter n=3 Tax=Alphaproteobacteria TaxID=28211 RepID=A0A501XTB2_9SPHN|nr:MULTISPECIES: NADH-quinone oxidoreductase subunit K [Alphaproteobacteria]KIC58075.1 monovalent cation/H+ antiporter subunit C [Brevundimonas nasdae]TPE63776.1 cation:proton antiporter [Sandaracinobacter neustonicus]URI15444.1 NADH-quinone oxidoreductase subunit K [Brevundimonas albigilva]